jgi:ribonuclease D
LLARPDLEVVFHDADYDLRALDRDYQFNARRIFDTRVAAQLLGEPSVGLAALLGKHFGVQMNKKLQRADWSTRPLTAEMITYAAADTSHLTRLRDLLADRLGAAHRLSWAQEEFVHLEQLRWTAPSSEESHLRLKGARTLPPAARSVLRALHTWREQRAQLLDRAPFRILPNEALLAVARAMPRSTREMHAIHGLPGALARRYGSELLAAVDAGLAAPIVPTAEPGRSPRAKPDPALESRLERLKQLRHRRARELGLEPGVLCPNGTLAAIARSAPTNAKALGDVVELRRWQVEALGAAAILAGLAEPGV